MPWMPYEEGQLSRRWRCDAEGCNVIVPPMQGNYCERCHANGDRFIPIPEDDEHEEGQERCFRCSCWYDTDDMVTAENGHTYCEECYSELFTTCSSCDCEVRRSAIYISQSGDEYCDCCYFDNYRRCDRCGIEVDCDDICYSESHDAYYCGHCHCSSEYINEYHCGHDLYFHPRQSPSGLALYLGVELETDHYSDRGNVASGLANHNNDGKLFWMEDDSSLEDGIEIISQPCTLKYHLSSFPWKQIIKTCTDGGGRSHDTDTCGLHVHFNKMFFGDMVNINCLKLMYLFERFWDKFVVFSRRRGTGWLHYAAKYNDDFTDVEHADMKVLETRDKGRYFAVNLTHRNTVEIRIFKGTLILSTLFASLELVDFLVRFVKDRTIQELQRSTWETLVNSIGAEYVNLNAYLVNKHLKGG